MNSSESKLSEGWSTLLLLTGMVMCVTWAISAPKWVDNIQIISWVAWGGLLMGILLAKARFSAWVAHFFSLVYGAAWISYLGTRLLPSMPTFRERLLELGYHINAWLWNVLHGGSSSDSLMFVLFLACVVWLLGYMTVWATYRARRIWWAILPTATVLLINIYWGPPRLLIYLIVYMGFMLLFFIRFNLFLQQRSWSEARVRYDPEIVWDFLRYGLGFIAVVMALAWGAPGAAASKEMADFLGRFSEPWERVQDTWNRLFFSSRYYGQAQASAFGTTMSLGGAVHLDNRVVMDVAAPTGRYWRAAVYDEYTGSGWANNDEEVVYLGPYDAGFVVPQFEMRRIITQTYTSYAPGRTQLLAAAEPLAVNRMIKVRNQRVIGRLPTERRSGELLNVSMIFARSSLEGGESYAVISAISAADEERLRAAGDDYPKWVTARYLQLPDSLPRRVRDLAEALTRDATSPYDKAQTLEAYLRQIKYNELIKSPPLEQDRVDWFLFDLKEGYCDYYSSAMAVMARAVGIPARVAVGYAQGEYVSEAGIYRVRDNNAHAWVEIYFPRYGWIEYEPTAAEPVIVRPKPAPTNTNNVPRPTPALDDELDRLRGMIDQRYDPIPLPEQSSRPWWVPVLWVASGLLLVTVMIGGSYWWLEERDLVNVGLVRKVYARMVRFGHLLKVPEREPQTPFEYAAALSAEVPAGQRPIYRIAELFVEEQFSPRRADEEASVSEWHALRPSMWKRWLSRWLERFQAPLEENDLTLSRNT